MLVGSLLRYSADSLDGKASKLKLCLNEKVIV